MKKIYFLCNGNSNRAQMAEGFARTYLKGKFECLSTSYPDKKTILDQAISVMNEIGIDITAYSSPDFCPDFYKEADYVISICENDMFDVNFIPTKARHIHIQLEEPLEYEDYFEQLQSFRKIRDQIGVVIKQLSLNNELLTSDDGDNTPLLFQ